MTEAALWQVVEMRNAKCVVRNEGGGAQLIKRRFFMPSPVGKVVPKEPDRAYPGSTWEIRK